MTRTEFIRIAKMFIEEHKLDVKTTYVIAGGAVVLHQLREQTNDIDIQVSLKDQARLLETYPDSLHPLQKLEITYMDIVVEVVTRYPVRCPEQDLCYMSGLRVQNPKSLYDFKTKMNRPKDAVDIQRLSTLLGYPTSKPHPTTSLPKKELYS